MDRRAFVTGLGAVLAAAVAAEAQTRTARIGYISAGSQAADLSVRNVEALREGLRDLGWVEGRNLIIEYRFAEDQVDRLPALAADLVRSRVDVIFSYGNPANHAVKSATTTIPIVVVSADPVAFGLVRSFAKPGGNITGVSVLSAELSAKRIELLKEAAPKVSRVAYLVNPANPASTTILTETQAAARSLGLQLQIVSVTAPGDLDSAFSSIIAAHAEAVVVQHDPMLQNASHRIVDLAASHRLVTVGETRDFVTSGGFLSYAAPFDERHRRGAALVDKILRGALPSDLPIERPTVFELFINLKTAKALGLTIRPSLLLRADQVIE
jgi:putative ABC transport system substrate-binding protein